MKRAVVSRNVGCLAALAAAGWISGSAAAQDFTVRMKKDDGKTTTIYVTPKAVRSVAEGSQQETVFRLDEGRILLIDHRNRTWSEISAAEAGHSSAGVPAGMSGRQRELMHRMGFDAAPTLTSLGAGETIAGYATQKYLLRTPVMQMEISAAPGLPVPPGYYDLASARVGQATMLGDMSGMMQEMKKIDGFTLKQVTTLSSPMTKGVVVSETAISVDRGPIQASSFEPPAGYRKIQGPAGEGTSPNR